MWIVLEWIAFLILVVIIGAIAWCNSDDDCGCGVRRVCKDKKPKDIADRWE